MDTRTRAMAAGQDRASRDDIPSDHPARQGAGVDPMLDARFEARMERRVRRLFAPAGSSPVATLCTDLDLVVALQRCARVQPERLASLLVRHGRLLDLWLFGVALSCAGLGLTREADLLLDAVPGIHAAGCGRRELLAELVAFGVDEGRGPQAGRAA